MSIFGDVADETFTTPNNEGNESALDGEITADDEMDFTSDGIKGQRALFQITRATRQRKNGGDVLAVLQYTAVDNEVLGFPVTETYWLSHSNPKAQSIGRSRIKPIFNALFGAPTGPFNDLLGKYVSMWLKEGKDGRATVSSPQTVSTEALEATVGGSL